MPLYEYQCATCGRFEVIRKFSDKALKRCPTCGKKIEKLASAPAFHLKGTGWYVTDYARKSNGGSEKADKDKSDKKDSDAKADSGTKADAKSGDTKTAGDSSTAPVADKKPSASKAKKSPASDSSPA